MSEPEKFKYSVMTHVCRSCGHHNEIRFPENSSQYQADRIKKLEQQLADQADKIQGLVAREEILVDAMAEIKASIEGHSDQPIEDIVHGCIDELQALTAYKEGK